MQESKTTEIKEYISNVRPALIFKILGNLLLVLIKIVSLPIIAVCFFISVGLDLIGKPIFAIITLLGSAAILFMFWEFFTNGEMKPNLLMIVICSVYLGGLLLAIEYIPKAFAGIAGLLIALLPVWFK